VQDCPKPPAEDAWQSVDDFPARTFATPADAWEWARVLTRTGESLREAAALAMLGQGDPSVDVAGRRQSERAVLRDQIEHTRNGWRTRRPTTSVTRAGSVTSGTPSKTVTWNCPPVGSASESAKRE